MKTEKGKPYQLKLTPQQREKLRELTGKDAEALQLTVEELEERIAPVGSATSQRPGDADVRVVTTSIPVGRTAVEGDLALPPGTGSVVLVAHGSGSSRRSHRNQYVARVLREEGLGTLLLDLLTPEEQAEDRMTSEVRFDVPLLAQRVIGATDWLGQQADTRDLRAGYVGASTGGSAALVAAAARPRAVGAIVSRGGRPDLAGSSLPLVEAPTLFLVGSCDEEVLELTHAAMARMRVETALSVIAGAGHVFDEPGALAEAARLTAGWLRRWLPAAMK